MNDQKLKIRIQLAQEPKSIDELYPETEKQEEPDKPPFDRQKILLALLVLLFIGFIIGLISYFIFFGNDKEQPLTEIDPVITTQEKKAPSVDIPLDKSTISEADEETVDLSLSTNEILVGPIPAEKPNKTDLTSEPEVNHTADLAEKPDEYTIAPPAGIQLNKPTISEAKEEAVDLSLSANEILIDPAPTEKPTKTDLTSDPEVNHTADLAEKPNESTIAETNALASNMLEDQPQIIRAQLTSAIQQLEPIDQIDHVRLDQGNTEQIFFFMQLRNLMGQRVSVHWHYQDRVVAKVPLVIGSGNWRTYASKLLNKTGLGAWQVTLHDQTGKLLSQRSFTVGDRP
jgi:cytoskeletal protein RodZ